MQLMLSLLVFVLYFLLLLVYLISRKKSHFTVIDYFFLFFSLQFGPHAAFPYFFFPMFENNNLWAYSSEESKNMYFICLALGYIGIAVGFIIGNIINLRSKNQTVQAPNFFPSGYKNSRVILFSILYILVFVYFGTTQTLLNFFNYLISNSPYTYNELRYILTESSKLTGFTRFSITVFLFSVLVSTFFIKKEMGVKKSINMIIALAVFFLCALQMSKLGTIYYALLTLLIAIHVKSSIYDYNFFKSNLILALSVTIITISAMIYFQYSSIFHSVDKYSFIFSLLAYRVFFSNSDGLVLFLDLYPRINDYTYFNNVGLIATIFDLKFEESSTEVAKHFLGLSFDSVDSVTSIQSGYVAFSYASFGLLGVFFMSIIVGWIIVFLTRISLRFNNIMDKSAFTASVGLSTYFLSSSPLHTALLSQGLALIPILFYFKHKLKS